MFIRLGSIVFAASEFRRLVFNDDGTATLFLAGEADGFALSAEVAAVADRLFQVSREPDEGFGGLGVCVAS